MSDFLIDNLPISYRLDLSEKLSTCIRQGKSINIIGMPAIGKSTYINFFLKNTSKYFSDHVKREFVQINVREFSGKNITGFKTFLKNQLLFLNKNEGINDIEKYIIAISKQTEIILIIKHLDELDRKLINNLFAFFLNIRQLPYKVRFIFLSNRPLSEFTDDTVVKSRLLGTEEYFKPDTIVDFWLEISEYEKYLEIKFDEVEKKKIYQLTGGHNGYLKLVMSYEKEKRLKYQTSDIYKRINDQDLPEDLIIRSKEIIRILNPNEIDYLSKLNKLQKNNTAPLLLSNLGLIKDERGHQVIFSLILNRFLQTQ